MRKIMFICTGNICRSAMTEKMLQKRITEEGLEDKIQAFSAGLYAYSGDVPTYEAIKVMRELYGIDITKHQAQNVRDFPMEEMDVILCMTHAHKATLVALFPKLKDRIHLIKEYVGLTGEVIDPYGGTLTIYTNCAKELKEYIELLIKKEEEK